MALPKIAEIKFGTWPERNPSSSTKALGTQGKVLAPLAPFFMVERMEQFHYQLSCSLQPQWNPAAQDSV